MGAAIVDHRFVGAHTLKLGDYAMVTLNGRPVLLQRVGGIPSDNDSDLTFINPDTGSVLRVNQSALVQIVQVSIHID